MFTGILSLFQNWKANVLVGENTCVKFPAKITILEKCHQFLTMQFSFLGSWAHAIFSGWSRACCQDNQRRNHLVSHLSMRGSQSSCNFLYFSVIFLDFSAKAMIWSVASFLLKFFLISQWFVLDFFKIFVRFLDDFWDCVMIFLDFSAKTIIWSVASHFSYNALQSWQKDFCQGILKPRLFGQQASIIYYLH